MLPLILMLVLAGAPKPDPKLAGRWTLDGEPFCTLKADGTGSFDEDRVRWGVDGDELVIKGEDETERVAFSLSGDTLTLHMGGIPLTLTRAGKGGTTQGQAAQDPPAKKTPGAGEAGKSPSK